MKIAHILTGNIEIPPKNWGAIEKMIWNYKLFFESLGHEFFIVDLHDQRLLNKEFDIVHVYIENQARELASLGIPYFFSMCDHHACIYGKESQVYLNNCEAIDKSIITTFPGEFLLSYFDFRENTVFLPLGVDTNLYSFYERKTPIDNVKLLCVANNGTLRNKTEDRKGFLPAINVAKRLNYFITIAGPTNSNKDFFDVNIIDYPKLNIVYDKNESELIKLYQDHHIFLHPSNIETGHPNLTMIESMSTGLPFVGCYWGGEKDIIKTSRDENEIIEGIKIILSNYQSYQSKAREIALKYDWKLTGQKTLDLYNQYINNKFRNSKFYLNSQHIFERKLDFIYNTDYRKKEEIKNSPLPSKPIISINFIDGAFIEIKNKDEGLNKISFIDQDSNSILYQTTIGNNSWAKSSKQDFTNYKIKAESENFLFEHVFSCFNKRVFFAFESRALGDTLAWFPYVEEFRKKHSCHCVVSTFHNYFFKNTYSHMEFVEPGSTVDNLYASYRLGIFNYLDKNIHKNDPRLIPLQKIASDILGLDFIELKPNIFIPNNERKIKDKYVCLFTESTAQAKYWNRHKGWQNIINYLNNKGYKVLAIKENSLSGFNGVIDIHNESLIEIAKYIKDADFNIGLGSGLSWLSWALNKSTILISGFSHTFSEFQTPYRVINKNVCHGCFNDNRFEFDRGDWEWCPVYKGTDKHFECTKEITPEMVIEQINKLI